MPIKLIDEINYVATSLNNIKPDQEIMMVLDGISDDKVIQQIKTQIVEFKNNVNKNVILLDEKLTLIRNDHTKFEFTNDEIVYVTGTIHHLKNINHKADFCFPIKMVDARQRILAVAKNNLNAFVNHQICTYLDSISIATVIKSIKNNDQFKAIVDRKNIIS